MGESESSKDGMMLEGLFKNGIMPRLKKEETTLMGNFLHTLHNIIEKKRKKKIESIVTMKIIHYTTTEHKQQKKTHIYNFP